MNVTSVNLSTTTSFPERFRRQTRHGKCSSWYKGVPLAIAWTVGMSLASLTSHAIAQSDVEADPSHHRQLFENDRVRSLTGGAQRLHFPDGTFADPPPSAPGAAFLGRAGRIQPENLRNARLEFIVVEPKSCK